MLFLLFKVLILTLEMFLGEQTREGSGSGFVMCSCVTKVVSEFKLEIKKFLASLYLKAKRKSNPACH